MSKYSNRKDEKFVEKNDKDVKSTGGKSTYKGKSRRKSNSKPRTSQDVQPRGNDAYENDVSWYNKYPELMKDAAKISFFNPAGNQLDIGGISPTDFVDWIDDNLVIPGIARLDYVPSIGTSNNTTSQINIAARQLYTYIRAANAGKTNYEPADLMMYILAMDQCYSFYAYLVRIYGTVRLFNAVNKYLPVQLLRSMGLDYEDIRNNAVKLHNYINTFAAKLGSLVLPSETSYSLRHQWMNLNYFTDAATTKGQIYYFNPKGFYQYDETGSVNGGQLKFVPVSNTNTVDSLIAYGDSLMNAVVGSSDCWTMSGDILKAFGTDGIFKLSPLDENFVILPAYRPEVLMQIKNTTLVPELNLDSLTIGQSATTGAILYTPNVIAQCISEATSSGKRNYCVNPFSEYLFKDKLIDVPVDVPTDEVIMVATRLSACADKVHQVVGEDMAGTAYMDMSCVGTEIVCDISFTTNAESNSSGLSLASAMPHATVSSYYPAGSVFQYPDKFIQIIAAAQHFDWMPMMFAMLYTGNITLNGDPVGTHTAEGPSTGVLGSVSTVMLFETQNTTSVTADQLSRLHEVALLSELTFDKARLTR